MTEGDTSLGVNTAAWGCARGFTGKSAGKYYFEAVYKAVGAAASAGVGVGTTGASLAVYPGATAAAAGYESNGTKAKGSPSAYGSSWDVAGSVIGVALDMDAKKVWFSLNNVWQASGDPVAGTGEAFASLGGTLYPIGGCTAIGSILAIHTKAPAFVYAPPTGYSAWDV